MPSPSPLRQWSALLSLYIIWGSTYLGIRYAIGADTGEPGLPPLLMAGVRFLLAGVFLLAIAVRRPAADGAPDRLGSRQWKACAIVGLSLLLGGNGLVVLSEEGGLDSGIAAVIIATLPIFTALIGWVRAGERLPPVGVMGLALGFAGVLVLFNPGGATDIDVPGAVMCLVATMLWAAGSYYSRGAPLPRRPLVTTGMEMVCGGAGLFVAGLVMGELGDVHLADAGVKAWLGFAYLVVFGSLVAFTAFVWLLANVRLSLVTTYAYVNPVVAVLLGSLFLDEQITARTLVGCGVIIVGVALIVSIRRSAMPPGEKVGRVVPIKATEGAA